MTVIGSKVCVYMAPLSFEDEENPAASVGYDPANDVFSTAVLLEGHSPGGK